MTAEAAAVVQELLLGSVDNAVGLQSLGWSRLLFIAKATGREPISEIEAEQVEHIGIRWLTLG